MNITTYLIAGRIPERPEQGRWILTGHMVDKGHALWTVVPMIYEKWNLSLVTCVDGVEVSDEPIDKQNEQIS